MVRKLNWKSLKLSLLSKIVNQKEHYISGGIAEISAKDLNDPGMVILIHLSYLSRAKVVGSWRTTVDYYKFNQVVIPIAAAIPDVALLL